MRDIFTKIHDDNFWGNAESVSGNGSTMEATSAIRSVLPLLFDHYDIKSIVDVACGDLNWIADLVIGKRSYHGMDIVGTLVEKNRVKYGGLDHVYFSVTDITVGPIPKVDLILARDVLVHFDNSEVKRALAQFKASGSTYLLATTFPEHHISGDQLTGQWRPINMAEYWGLGNPIEFINEQSGIKGFEDKSLGLWRLK